MLKSLEERKLEEKNKVPFGAKRSSFGSKPSNGNFGKKPNNGSFGKKPTKGDFGKKPSKPLVTKKKLSKKSTKSLANSEEREYLSWLKSEASSEFSCFVCGKIKSDDRIEWHHVKLDSSSKKNHKRLIPLCGHEHHRLGTVMSPHGTPKKFREQYPIEVQNGRADEIYNYYLSTKSEK